MLGTDHTQEPKENWKQKRSWNSNRNDTDTMIVTRIPPQNIDAEKSVLGAMLLDKDAILTAEDKLNFAGQFTLFYEITNMEPPPDMM